MTNFEDLKYLIVQVTENTAVGQDDYVTYHLAKDEKEMLKIRDEQKKYCGKVYTYKLEAI